MNKIIYKNQEDAIVRVDDHDFLVTSGKFLASWGRYNEAKEYYKQTAQKLKQWYSNCGNLTAVFDNCRKIFDIIVGPFIESNIQDFIDNGHLYIDKSLFIEAYEKNAFPYFYKGLQYLTDFWFDIQYEEQQKENYRELRKENRPRIMGFGFGLTGGIKASASAGLGNMSSGIAHSAFNTIAKGISSIQATNQLNKFYQDASTFNVLAEGWENCFWSMYDTYIQIVNDSLCETSMDINEILNSKELNERSKSIDNLYSNLQRANLEHEEYLVKILELIESYPVNIELWKDFLSNALPFDRYTAIIVYASKFIEIDPSFFVGLFILIMNALIEQYCDNAYNGKNEECKEIIAYINDDYIKEMFFKYFPIYFSWAYSGDMADISNEKYKNILSLLENIGYDYETFRENEEMSKIIQKIAVIISNQFINENAEKLFSLVEEGNIEEMVNLLNSEIIENRHCSIVYLINLYLSEYQDNITAKTLKYIEDLNVALGKSLGIDRCYNSEKNSRYVEMKKIAGNTAFEQKFQTDDDFQLRVKRYNLLKEKHVLSAYEFKQKNPGRTLNRFEIFLHYVFFRAVIGFSICLGIFLLLSFLGIDFGQVVNIGGLILFSIIGIATGSEKKEEYVDGKEAWKICTNNGELDINDLFKEYKEIEEEIKAVKGEQQQ
jgi:hypothetical protein